MKKYNLLLLLFVFVCASSFAGIKVGKGGDTMPSLSLADALETVRLNQDGGDMGDTIFLSGVIDVDSAQFVDGNGAPSDGRYNFVIVGEGSDNTILKGATVAEGNPNLGAKFIFFGADDATKAPVVHMEGLALEGFNTAVGSKGIISFNNGTTATLKDVKVTDCTSTAHIVNFVDIDAVTVEDCLFEDLLASTAILTLFGNDVATVWGDNANTYVMKNTTIKNAIGTNLGAVNTRNIASLEMDGCVLDSCTGNKVISNFIHPKVGVEKTDIVINNCAIVNNVCTKETGAGGVVYLWDGNNDEHEVKALITGCLFFGNESKGTGSCVYLSSPKSKLSVEMYNNTMANNIESGIAAGGAIYVHVDMGALALKNNIVYGTKDPNGLMCRDLKVKKAMPYIELSNNILENVHDIDTAQLDLTGNYSSSWRDADSVFIIGMPEMYDENYQLIPTDSSTALNNGVVIPGYDFTFSGSAPDLGAYQTIIASSSIKPNNTPISVTLYPVPAQNTLNIKCTESVAWEMYSITGSLLNSGNGNQVDVSTLGSGTYFIRITDKNGQTAIKQFVK